MLDGAPGEIRTPDPQIRSLLLHLSVSGDGESRCRGDALRGDACTAITTLRQSGSSKGAGAKDPPIPLIRRSILFYDRCDPALPMVIGGLHHKRPGGEWTAISETALLAPAPSNWPPLAMPRPAIIPTGSWPRRMRAELAAGYCGEPTVEAFLKRVGSEYPQPRIIEGRRRLWLRDDLDQAILPEELRRDRDVAEDL